MAESGFDKFARSLGRLTGRLLEKAHDAGLDDKAKEVVGKTKERLERLVEEAKRGAAEAEAESAEEEPAEGEAPKEESDGVVEESSAGEVQPGAKFPDGNPEAASEDKKPGE